MVIYFAIKITVNIGSSVAGHYMIPSIVIRFI